MKILEHEKGIGDGGKRKEKWLKSVDKVKLPLCATCIPVSCQSRYNSVPKCYYLQAGFGQDRLQLGGVGVTDTVLRSGHPLKLSDAEIL
jgi:hypothetical protein